MPVVESQSRVARVELVGPDCDLVALVLEENIYHM